VVLTKNNGENFTRPTKIIYQFIYFTLAYYAAKSNINLGVNRGVIG
jgi:hypothetical protein